MVIANSQFTANNLVQAGISRARVRTIYIGGAIADWGERRISKDRETFEILSVGRLQDHKGFQVLLQAAKLLMMESIDARVRIVGKGPSGRRLTLLARELGIAHLVEFLGHVGSDQLQRLYD